MKVAGIKNIPFAKVSVPWVFKMYYIVLFKVYLHLGIWILLVLALDAADILDVALGVETAPKHQGLHLES